MARNLRWNRTAALLLACLFICLSAGCGNSADSLQTGSVAAPSALGSDSAAETPASPPPAATPDKPPVPSKLETVAFFSEALGVKKKIKIYLPPGYDPSVKYPVLYMLHGYNGTESAWMPEMGLNREADRLILDGSIHPLIIAAPEMDNSYGLNSSEKYVVADPKHPAASRYYGRYEDYLVRDVLAFVDGHYSTVASREGRYIGGYSMGGFISLHAAFRHPDLFSKAGGHSAALWLDDWSRVPRMKSWLYPSKALRKERDPVELARTRDLTGLSVYLDCGDKDDFKLYNGAEKLYGILKARGIAAAYHSNPGNHSRTYWKSHIRDYLLFYAGNA